MTAAELEAIIRGLVPAIKAQADAREAVLVKRIDALERELRGLRDDFIPVKAALYAKALGESTWSRDIVHTDLGPFTGTVDREP